MSQYHLLVYSLRNAMRSVRPFLITLVAIVATNHPLPQVVLTSVVHAQNPLNERAYQDREILYELQAPETHAFRITHDYTVRKAGEKYYFNVSVPAVM